MQYNILYFCIWDIICNFAKWIGGLSTPTDKR